MWLKLRKFLLAGIIGMMMLAYYFYSTEKLSSLADDQPMASPSGPSHQTTPLSVPRPSQQSPSIKSDNSQPSYFIDSISWQDPYEISIDAMSGFGFLLDYLLLPHDIKQYLRNGDWLSAYLLLDAEPLNPDYVIALEILSGQCRAAIEKDPVEFQQQALQDPTEEPLLTAEEAAFFRQYQQRLADVRQHLRDVCVDLNNNFNLDPEVRKQALSQMKDSYLAQLVVESNHLKREQLVQLFRNLLQQEQSLRAKQSLFQLLIDSSNPTDLQEAINLFQTMPSATVYEYLALARCLKKSCQNFAEQLAPREHWLKLAAQQGEYQPLWLEQIQQKQWQELAAWSQYKIALLKFGCSDSLSFLNGKAEYLKIKKQLNEALAQLSAEQQHQAKITAGELYQNYADQAKRWLGCG
jgi:hypothetical protein